MEPEELFASADGIVRVARFGRIFAGVFQKGLTAQVLDEVRAWQHTVMPEEPIFSFSMSFAAERLEPDVRAATDRLLAEFRDRTAAAATVLRVFGFEGSAARAMLATIYLFTRAAYPRKVFSNLAEADQWLRSIHDDGADIDAATRWLTAQDIVSAGEQPATPS
ncbi:MAG: hypothetical protein AAF721_24105 [Myxococcota bacterium]